MTLAADIMMPEYSLVVSTDIDMRLITNTVLISPDILSGCPTPHELKTSMLKRLNVAGKPVSGPNLCVVAMMCLASVDYSVSHVSLCGVTERYMLKVWSYLERQVVSSSYQLRQWMRSRVGTRTCEGYMAHWNISRNLGSNIGNTYVSVRSWSKCINVTNDMANKICGQPTTILEAAHNDITTSSKIKALLDC